MTGINVTYEEWLDGDPGWLRVIIERQNTGEVLSAFTQPAAGLAVRKLKEDLEAGKPAQSDLEFINYFCPGTDQNEEINDDLDVVMITGYLEQASAFGAPQLSFHLHSHAVRSLVAQVLRERSYIDMKLLEFLGAIAPTSFASFADELETEDGDIAEHVKPTATGQIDSRLAIDKGSGEARWDGMKLNMNGRTHFDLLSTLHDAQGKVVKWLDLLHAVMPHTRYKVEVGSLSTTPKELSGPLRHVRNALRQANSAVRIQTVRGHGCRLLTPPK